MIVALLLTMVCCIVLGMGVPTTATYCIMAATCAPILMSPDIGVEMLAAHFFVFYFGIVADITPPVALAAYAGAAISGGDPLKTGVNASKLGIAAFIVPYVFVLSPALLGINASAGQIVMTTITALIGMIGISSAMMGYLYRRLNAIERLIIFAAGLCLIDPESFTDLVGIVVMVAVVLFQYMRERKAAR